MLLAGKYKKAKHRTVMVSSLARNDGLFLLLSKL